MNVLATKCNLTARVIIYFNTQTVYPEMLGGWCAKFDVTQIIPYYLDSNTFSIVMPHNTTLTLDINMKYNVVSMHVKEAIIRPKNNL